MEDQPIFFGTKSEYRKIFKDQPIPEDVNTKEEEPEEEEAPVQRVSIEWDNLGPLPDDIEKILRTTRLRNDPLSVMMQSDIAFYDQFYMEDEDDDLTIAARNIRRTYRVYLDYWYACRIRERYIDRLYEEVYKGDDLRFQAAVRSGTLPWVPPIPFYAPRVGDEYDELAAQLGLFSVGKGAIGMDEEAICEFFDEHMQDATSNDVYFDVETNLSVINAINDDAKDQVAQNGYHALSSNDIKEIQAFISTWYTRDQEEETELDKRALSMTPGNIRKRYFQSFKMDVTDHSVDPVYDAFGNELPYANPNDLVYDPKTGKPMTFAELTKRQLLRHMVNLGWSELPLMNALNIGSRSERISKEMSFRSKRKNKLKRSMREEDPITGSFSYYGDDAMGALDDMFGGGLI